MYGRSFGTANGDYIVPEKYGGTVYKRPAEKAEKPAQPEPRMTPVNGGLRLSQMAAEMHEKDLKRITGEPSDAIAPEETAPEPAGEKPDDSKVPGKKRFPDISEEDLLVIALIMLMLGGSQPGEAKREEEREPSEAGEPAPVPEREKAPSPSNGDDVLIPLLLTLLIW